MRTRAARLVGLASEFGQCRDLVDAVRDGGHGALFVLGPAGHGKSRLLAETDAHARRNQLSVLRGRARSLGLSSPFEPLTEALAALSRQGRLPGRAELGGYLPLLSRILPDVTAGERVGDPDDAPPGAVAEAVLRVLAHCGWRDGGCVLLLEDLHLADVETLGVVDYLVDNLAGLPVGVLASARTAPADRSHPVPSASDGSPDARREVAELAGGAERRGTADVVRVPALRRSDLGAFAASCLPVRTGASADEDGTDAVDGSVCDLLWQASNGVPLVVEETLFALVSDGQLHCVDGRWRLAPAADEPAPGSLADSLTGRLRHLDPLAREVALLAATLAEPFPVDLIRQVLQVPGASADRAVQSAVAAQLLVSDERPGWFALAHPLVGDTLAAGDPVADRARRAGALADAMAALWPGLPGGRAASCARLLESAGRVGAAAALWVDCARRALSDGNAASAAGQAEQAIELTAGDGSDGGLSVAAVRILVDAALAGGQPDRAARILSGRPAADEGADESLPPAVVSAAARLDGAARTELGVRLAWALFQDGRVGEAADQLAAVELGLSVRDDERRRAAHDAVLANVIVDRADAEPDRLHRAERMARAAVEVADRHGDAETACRAWNAIGQICRDRDPAEAARCFERIVELADENHLPGWRVSGLAGAAGNAWLRDGGRAGFDVARAEADRVGAVSLSLAVDATLALHEVLVADYDEARRDNETCLREARRVRSSSLVRYCLATEAIRCAHHGDRVGLSRAVERFDAAGGRGSVERPLVVGLGSAVGCLLAMDRAGAGRQFDLLDQLTRRTPSTFHLTGAAGLRVLLDVLDGRVDEAQLRTASASVPGQMRWNRQFVAAARAVHAGRDGRTTDAQEQTVVAQDASEIFPLAGHLWRWLVAGDAVRDGWGEPEMWLRAAEGWFHDHGITAAAADCRNRLRTLGAHVGQRRTGTDELPTGLRSLGVTVREYEVLRLAVERLGNRAIGERLHISPRTVEKHVAAAVLKLQVDDREGLITRGRALLDGG